MEQCFVNDFFHKIAVLPKGLPVRICSSVFIEDTSKPVKSLCLSHQIESSDRDNHDSCKKTKRAHAPM